MLTDLMWVLLVLAVTAAAVVLARRTKAQIPLEPAPTADSITPEPTGSAPPAPAAGASRIEIATEAPALSNADALARLHGLALGAIPGSAPAKGHEAVEAATIAALDDAATQQRYAPRRPNLLPRLLSVASDDAASRRELAALIARDPSLVGNLLKIANSAFYRVSAQPVESVDRAVVLLGTDGIRSLIAAALMQPIFRIGATQFPRFPEIAWEHAIRSASAAVPHAALVENCDPFAAELLSLVMGLAAIVVFRATLDQYEAKPRLRPDAGVIADLLETRSPSVAQLIGASWELSERSLAALRDQASADTSDSTPLGRSLRYGRVAGALAVLQINKALDDGTARASMPASSMDAEQFERMWTRLTAGSPKAISSRR